MRLFSGQKNTRHFFFHVETSCLRRNCHSLQIHPKKDGISFTYIGFVNSLRFPEKKPTTGGRKQSLPRGIVVNSPFSVFLYLRYKGGERSWPWNNFTSLFCGFFLSVFFLYWFDAVLLLCDEKKTALESTLENYRKTFKNF